MKTVEERIRAAEEKLKQLRARQQKIDAQERAAKLKRSRAEDTRRKVLIGAMYLERMIVDSNTQEKVLRSLSVWLTRADDRALFDLPPLAASQPVAQPTGG